MLFGVQIKIKHILVYLLYLALGRVNNSFPYDLSVIILDIFTELYML